MSGYYFQVDDPCTHCLSVEYLYWSSADDRIHHRRESGVDWRDHVDVGRLWRGGVVSFLLRQERRHDTSWTLKTVPCRPYPERSSLHYYETKHYECTLCFRVKKLHTHSLTPPGYKVSLLTVTFRNCSCRQYRHFALVTSISAPLYIFIW